MKLQRRCPTCLARDPQPEILAPMKPLGSWLVKHQRFFMRFSSDKRLHVAIVLFVVKCEGSTNQRRSAGAGVVRIASLTPGPEVSLTGWRLFPTVTIIKDESHYQVD